MGNVRDPVHGVIRLRPVESVLLETLPLQRLRRVRQLGLTHYVFPGVRVHRCGCSLEGRTPGRRGSHRPTDKICQRESVGIHDASNTGARAASCG